MSRKKFNIILWPVLIFLFFTPTFLPRPYGFLTAYLGLCLATYSRNLLIAEVDMRAGIARKIKLPLWEKRLLFPFQHNQFAKKTVIAQRIWTYYLLILVISNLVISNSNFLTTSLWIQFALFFILIMTCDLHTRKGSSIRYMEEEEKRNKQRRRKMYEYKQSKNARKAQKLNKRKK